MWVKILRGQFAPIVAALSSEVGTFRLLTFLALPTILAFGVYAGTDRTDPWIFRIILASAFSIVFGLTFVSATVRRHINHFIHVLLAATTFWIGILSLVNGLVAEYLVAYLAVLLFSGINFRNGSTLALFALGNFAIGIAAFFVTNAPIWDLVLLLILIFALTIASYIGLAFRATVQRELRRTSDLLNSLLENSPDAILITNLETAAIRAHNRNAERIFGADDRGSALHEHLRGIIRELREETRNGQIAIRRELLLPRMDNSDFWAEVLVSPIDSGSRKLLLFTITDISARIVAEQSLQLSDHILQEVDHLVVVCDADANVVYSSPSVERILGYPVQEILGQNWWKLPVQSDEAQEEEKSTIMDIVAGRRPVRSTPYERSYSTSDGRLRSILWKDSLTHDRLLIGVGIENTEERRNSLVRSVIFNIAEASSKANSPGEFYGIIHLEIRRVIDTPNFYIAVYDQVADKVNFPYYADAEEPKPPFSRKAGKGLTELTIKRKKPLLAYRADINDLVQKGFVDQMVLPIPEVWLGVPLIHDEVVVGLITLQDYQDQDAFDAADLELLTFIAAQVAQFVSKLQADEALRLSEERFRAIYDQAAVGIAQIRPNGRFEKVNHRMTEIFGYPEETLVSVSPIDITHEEDIDIGRQELKEVLDGTLDSYTVEKRYIHLDGHLIYARVNVSAYKEGGKIRFIISVYEDITERIKAQQETATLYALSKALDEAPDTPTAFIQTLEHLRVQGLWIYGEAWQHMGEGQFECVHTSQHHPEHVPQKTEGQVGHGLAHIEQLQWWTEFPTGLQFARSENFSAAGYQTLVSIPVVAEGQVKGLLILANRKPRQSSEREERFISAAVSQLRTFLLRHSAELAQKESEARYRAITEAAFEGIAIHREGQILKANNAFATIFGREGAELEGSSILDLASDDASRAALQKIVYGEGSATLTSTRPDGTQIYLEAVGRPGTWEGFPAGVVAMRDTTNERLMEEARESARLDARFRAYVQNSTEIIQILDAQGMIQYASPTLERYTGIEPESVVGTDFFSIMHPYDVQEVRDLLADIMEQPMRSDRVRLRLLTEEGEWRHFQVAFTNLLEDTAVKGILVSAHDITDIVLAQRSMVESEARFRTLFDRSPDAVFVEDEEGTILDINEQGAQLHEMPREELVGLTVFELMPEASRETAKANFRKLFTGEISYLEGVSHGKSGKVTPIEIRSSSVQYEDKTALILQVRDITERKRSAEKLAATLEKMRATFDSTLDGILVVDNQGIVLDYNARFLDITGLDQQQLAGGQPHAGLDELADLMEQPRIFRETVAKLEANPGDGMRYVFARKDGRVFEFYNQSMRHEDVPIGRLWFFHDVTDLKRTEAALQENETKFRAIFSQANDAILVLEAYHIIECNGMAEEMFGLNRLDLLSRDLFDFSPELQPDGSNSRSVMASRTGDALDGNNQYFNWKHRRENGELFDAEISMSQIRIGEKLFVQCVVRDITERVTAERALRESERRNKAILDAIPDLMLRITDEGRVLDFKAADRQDLIGGDVTGLLIKTILPASIAGKVMESAKAALYTGEGQQFETEVIIEEESRDYETRLVRSGNREALVIIRDVTARKRTEKELIKRNFELDSFVYRASHDLKAPLNSLMGLINIMAAESPDPAVQGYLRMMNKSVVKLDTFIRDLADFSRNARMEVETTTVDWQALVNETLDNLKFMENAERVEKQVEINQQGSFVSDAVRIGIIFNNLISNAIKYQNLQRTDAWVRITIDCHSDRAVIKITDNGIGIAEEHLNKVFNLFFRASVQSYGSGMGMYIVKNAVERLKGHIDLQSRLGEGSTFTIIIPRSTDTHP